MAKKFCINGFFLNRIKVLTKQGIVLRLHRHNIASNLVSVSDCKYGLICNTFIRVYKLMLRFIGTYSYNFLRL